MERADYVVVGAGVSGLTFANAILHEASTRGDKAPEIVILEADDEPGGYCKTVFRSGFTWDYSGHFFHFRHPEIEEWLRERMPEQEIFTVVKRALIRFAGRDIDFPFQKNIHQLPRADFIDCLVSLFFREQENRELAAHEDSFRNMLYRRFGRGIAERFLIPYNEKLYACSMGDLDNEAMGRFFPHAEIADIIRNMREPDNSSYNQSFTYPAGGAIQYIRALLRDLPTSAIACSEPAIKIDLQQRLVKTPKRTIAFGRLITSVPLPWLLSIAGDPADRALSWNKVLVFNLGFDRKGPRDVHWMYFPEQPFRFYRVGFYDNIMGASRMSLYVEIGASREQNLDVEQERARVLQDLRAANIISEQKLVAWHSVVLNPAYVHLTQGGIAAAQAHCERYRRANVYSIGRYGGWRYSSIEDNMVEARALASELATS